MRAAPVVIALCLAAGCRDKSAGSTGSTGSGSGSGSGSATQTVSEALAIVCGSLERAKQNPRWAELEPAPDASRTDKVRATASRLGLMDQILEKEVTNPEVKAVVHDVEALPGSERWTTMLQKAGVTSCPYLEWQAEQAKKRADEDTAAIMGSGSAVAMGSSKHVPEGKFFRCTHKDRTFELWDGGGFEFRYNQVGIEGSYELRGQTIVFMPSDASKTWKDYTGLDSKELTASEDWKTAGPFTCSLN